MNPGSHPRDRRGIGRRDFLARIAGAGLASGGLGALAAGTALGGTAVAGCGRGYAAPPKRAPIPEPHNPVLWPIDPANRPIAGGLGPEKNATLRVYTWPGHVAERCLADFARRYRCEVQRIAFGTMAEALSVLSRGRDRFDVLLGAPTDLVGVLVGRSLLQPLNHGYIPNYGQTWTIFADPYYDSRWRYTVPYTVYTTGLAWRKDHVDADPYTLLNGWGFPWVAKASGRTAILNDYRASIGLALLKDGGANLDTAGLNTTDPYLINQARRELLDLGQLTGGLRVDNSTSRHLASGHTWVHLAWSGQAVAAARFLPRGTPADVIGYWFPPDGTGPVGNDTGAVLRGAQSPVLAHLLLNYLLDPVHAMRNIASTGYTQPISFATPGRLVSQGILPASLISAAVASTYFARGLKQFTLPMAGDLLWRQAWQGVSSRSATAAR